MSVAVMVIVKVPVEAYACVSDVVVPDRVSSEPSPQLTVMEVTVPSESDAVKVPFTNWPVIAGLGAIDETVVVG